MAEPWPADRKGQRPQSRLHAAVATCQISEQLPMNTFGVFDHCAMDSQFICTRLWSSLHTSWRWSGSGEDEWTDLVLTFILTVQSGLVPQSHSSQISGIVGCRVGADWQGSKSFHTPSSSQQSQYYLEEWDISFKFQSWTPWIEWTEYVKDIIYVHFNETYVHYCENIRSLYFIFES